MIKLIKKTIEKIGFGVVFLFLVVMGYLILGIFDLALLMDVLTVLIRLIVQIAPVLLIVFVVMFLTNLFFEGQRIVRLLGKGSGFRGWMVAIVGGIVSSGPIYMWYPLLSDLKEKGMRDSLIGTFLYNRTIKIPLLPMMVHYFGWDFTLTLSIYMVLFSVVYGVIVQRLTQRGAEG
jgi:uncharacterized membrane protein YraQ (UPF0718 family)